MRPDPFDVQQEQALHRWQQRMFRETVRRCMDAFEALPLGGPGELDPLERAVFQVLKKHNATPQRTRPSPPPPPPLRQTRGGKTVALSRGDPNR